MELVAGGGVFFVCVEVEKRNASCKASSGATFDGIVGKYAFALSRIRALHLRSLFSFQRGQINMLRLARATADEIDEAAYGGGGGAGAG